MSYSEGGPWSVVRLGDIANVYSGGTPSRRVPGYWGGPIPWITTAEINFGHISTARQTITQLGLENSATKIAPAGTVLLAMYGQGKTRGKSAVLDVDAAINQACAAIQVRDGLDAEFLLHYLTARYADLRAMSNSGSQDNLSGGIVRKIEIALPPFAEQKSIASMLTDSGRVVEGLAQQIAKKHAVKQGMMQELLTGQTRLAGFNAAWVESPIGSLIDGLTAGTSVRSVEGATRPAVLKTSAARDGRFYAEEAKSILPRDVGRATCTPEADSLIISRMNTPGLVGGVGYVEHAQPSLYLPDRLWLARSRPGTGTSMRWLAAMLSHGATARAVRDLATGTSNSMKNIPKSRLLTLRILTPPGDEQHAVAEVLRDADDEMDALERRLEATRAIKQGMMQALLAGRTRLVPMEVAE